MGPARIKTEPFLLSRPAKSADCWFSLKYNDLLPLPGKEPGKGDSGKSPTENRGLHIVYIVVWNLYG